MILSRPFQTVTPTVDGDVLFVLARAEAQFTPPQVRDLIGFHSVAGVRNALTRLTAQGIVVSGQVGRAYTYRLNRDHVAAQHVVGLADAGREVVRRMRACLAAWDLPSDYAALFGSAATGAMTAGSDLDLFVVRPDSADERIDDWHDQVDGLVESCVAWTGNDARVLEMSAGEVDLGVGTERVLVEIERDGVTLAGPASFLARRRALASARSV